MSSNADKNNIISRVGSLFKRQAPTSNPSTPVEILNGFSNGNLSPSEQDALRHSPFFVGNARDKQVIAPIALSDPVRSPLSPDHSFTTQTGSATSHLNDTTSHSAAAVDIKPTAENTLPWNYAMDTLHTNISNPQVLSKLTDNSAGIKFNGNGLSGGSGAIDSVTINGHTYTDLGHINGAIKHILDENHSNTNASTTISAQREDQILAMHAGRTTGNGASSDPVRSLSPDHSFTTQTGSASDSVRSGAGTVPSATAVNTEINTLNQERNLMGNNVSDSVRSGAGTTPAQSISPSQAMQAERSDSGFPPTSTYAVRAPQIPANPNGVAGNSPISADIKDSGWGGRPAFDPVNPIMEARSQTQSSTAKVDTQHPGHL